MVYSESAWRLQLRPIAMQKCNLAEDQHGNNFPKRNDGPIAANPFGPR
jgi:hypothetical protein